jgi:hypothetical protein
VFSRAFITGQCRVTSPSPELLFRMTNDVQSHFVHSGTSIHDKEVLLSPLQEQKIKYPSPARARQLVAELDLAGGGQGGGRGG